MECPLHRLCSAHPSHLVMVEGPGKFENSLGKIANGNVIFNNSEQVALYLSMGTLMTMTLNEKHPAILLFSCHFFP